MRKNKILKGHLPNLIKIMLQLYVYFNQKIMQTFPHGSYITIEMMYLSIF